MKKVSISFIILTILMALSSCQKKSSEKEILSFKFISPNIEASIEDRMMIATFRFPIKQRLILLQECLKISANL